MNTNDLLKNALDVLTMYRGMMPSDQYSKKVQPVVNDIRDYLAVQTLGDFKLRQTKSTGESITGFGLLDDAIRDSRNPKI